MKQKLTKRRPRFTNGLTKAEGERLALLLEECGEVVQIIGKIMRHGFESHHPAGGPPNRELLEDELGDVLAAITILGNAGDITGFQVEQARLNKLGTVERYLHHQRRAWLKP